ncbi:Obp56g family protein [Megaselia abdita]
MKSFVIFALFALAVVQAIEINKLLHEECGKQENVKPEEMAKIAQEGIMENASQTQKCFHKCVMEKIGYFKDGMLVEDKIVGDFSKNPAKEMMNTWFVACKEGKSADPCDTAYNYLLCMIKQSKV